MHASEKAAEKYHILVMFSRLCQCGMLWQRLSGYTIFWIVDFMSCRSITKFVALMQPEYSIVCRAIPVCLLQYLHDYRLQCVCMAVPMSA
jgi:hypothetical protein